MAQLNPPHPGETIKELILDPQGITVEEFAKRMVLYLDKEESEKLIAGKRKLTATIAYGLSRQFGGSTSSWITQQKQYDLSKRKQQDALHHQLLVIVTALTIALVAATMTIHHCQIIYTIQQVFR